MSLEHVYIIYNFSRLTTWLIWQKSPTPGRRLWVGRRASRPRALHRATLCLSVKGLLYCHATERLTLALMGVRTRTGVRGPATPLYTQGFIVINSGYVCQPKIKLLIYNSIKTQFMHSTVSRLSLEKYGMFRKEINHRGRFVSHIQFGNGSPTVDNFYKRKI